MPEEDPGLLATLRSLAASGSALPNQDFQRVLASKKTDVPAAEWSDMVKFVSEQHALWAAQWLLSPAASPDERARQEAEAWERTYTVCAEPLIEQFPQIRAPLERQHRLIEIGPQLDRRVTTSRSVQRAALSLLSNSAIFLNRIGLQRVGTWIYEKALYPKGTVGRAGG